MNVWKWRCYDIEVLKAPQQQVPGGSGAERTLKKAEKFCRIPKASRIWTQVPPSVFETDPRKERKEETHQLRVSTVSINNLRVLLRRTGAGALVLCCPVWLICIFNGSKQTSRVDSILGPSTICC